MSDLVRRDARVAWHPYTQHGLEPEALPVASARGAELVLEDGSVVLNTGCVDIGQGSDTVLTQICAEALKMPIEQVSVASPDTDGSPYNWGTTASRVTYMAGRAIVSATVSSPRTAPQGPIDFARFHTSRSGLGTSERPSRKRPLPRSPAYFDRSSSWPHR